MDSELLLNLLGIPRLHIPFGIVMYAFTLFLDNLCRNSCKHPCAYACVVRVN